VLGKPNDGADADAVLVGAVIDAVAVDGTPVGSVNPLCDPEPLEIEAETGCDAIEAVGGTV
jgi:hypothetical protein